MARPAQWPFLPATSPPDTSTVLIAEHMSVDAQALIAAVRPGQHLRLRGSRAFVGRLAALALAQGLLAEEIETELQPGPQQVWCARCRSTHVLSTSVDTFDCPACQTPLAVRHAQYSPLLGAVLAVPRPSEPLA